MDQFINNLVGTYKARLRQHSLHLISRGHMNETKIEGEFWEKLLQDGAAEDISNDILEHYTREFREETKKTAKEFVDQYGR